MDTEGRILAEIVSQIAETLGETTVIRKHGMGGTGIVYESLKSRFIDLYPEYTGTLWKTVLKKTPTAQEKSLHDELAALGLNLSEPLGFNNTYALALRQEDAQKRNLHRISDLKSNLDLRAGFTPEFLKHPENLSALEKHYGFKLPHIRSLDHGLAYEAVAHSQIDLIDAYSTDGKIKRFGLKVLEDDQHFFPDYQAAFLVRADFPDLYPKTWKAIQKLRGSLSSDAMAGLNARAEIDRIPIPTIAHDFLQKSTSENQLSFVSRYINLELAETTAAHLFLVLVSMTAAIVVGIPLGIFSYLLPKPGKVILALCGVIQTVPSLALLCFMIPWIGIGVLPSLVALFLYSLLPIVRGAYSGLMEVNPRYREVSQAIGLHPRQTLFWILLPLGRGAIWNGICVSAVINVGTATLAAFIGGGGYGTYIVTGLALNDISMILNGAIPAAILALVLHAILRRTMVYPA